eukprot:TRINITY_DN25690_c0_g1_i1.p1 TRINITY_DN25690_c0_g1~~TRINITY_DN25690_c0_g1_i1.p1  ORF type:complete len:111 (-),score=26.54 TRINITY_DN25690_c0_g1_i1:115-447(-)
MCFFFFKQKTAYEMLRSLVGSEMCIRDSSSTSLLPRWIWKTPGDISTTLESKYPPPRGRPVPLRTTPVSLSSVPTTILLPPPPRLRLIDDDDGDASVSYTHLTLPTKRIV